MLRVLLLKSNVFSNIQNLSGGIFFTKRILIFFAVTLYKVRTKLLIKNNYVYKGDFEFKTEQKKIKNEKRRTQKQEKLVF